MINHFALKRAEDAGFIELGSMSEPTMSAYYEQCRPSGRPPIYLISNSQKSRLAWIPIHVLVADLPEMNRAAREAVETVVARSKRQDRVVASFDDSCASGWVAFLELNLARELAATLSRVLHRSSPDGGERVVA